ncbi:uncharacterized protein Dana_GF21246 [Drosophila ananassae]|uniref:Defective chorion 1 n=1 Tax=Drosophila ananassae TaxID=7217 RepID=B3MRA8_DROAN|nr:uncharacterized protein Dana_GF21246 [Drosophila ananassae]
MRSHSQMLLLLALLGVQVAVHVSGQSPAEAQPQATVTSGSDATQALDEIEQEAARTKANESTQFIRPRFPTQDEMLSQMGPPIQPFSTNLPALDAFYMMFPALGSLLRWGSVFPMGSLLGAVPDTLLQPTGAASKVVLVLADDAAAKTRVPRQDSPPPPPNPLDWAANVGQMITNMQANPLLPPMPLDATLGAPLQSLLPLGSLTGILGQAAPAPAVSADPPPPPAPVPDTPAPAPASPPFSAFDPANLGQSITSMLSQAPPNFLSQMPAVPQIPQLQQFAQFLPQIPGLSQAPVGQASDISEVRVRPEIPYVTGTPQMKIKTALEKEQDRRREQEMDQEQDQERVPLLWFRLPVGHDRNTQGKPIEDLRVEAKLKAFERQVITELKMLQQIERMAKEMRTSAATGTAAQSSDYQLNYPLNHTPVHKITRADIEQALRDDYVRRLVQKEAQRRGFINRKTGGYKRQAFAEDKNLSKEEIVQIMAYAYRMANEQMAEAEKSKQDKIYAAYRSPAERQWSEDQAKKQEIQQPRQMIQQNPLMMPQHQQMVQQNQMIQQSPMMMQQRQWSEEQTKIQQERQWTEEQAKQQAIQQNNMMMQQQRQWSEEQAKIQQEEQAKQQAIQQNNMMMQQQRQWSEEQAKIQQNPTMMQQRQWSEDQAKQQQHMMQQQRQWTEEQAMQQAIAQQQAGIQQGPMMMQRQWAEEEAKALQDQQTMQQRQWDERQWADEKAKAQQQQSLQMGQTPIQMDQAPILQQMHQQPMMQQRMEQLLTHNPPTNLGQPAGDEDPEDATMLGEAGPQMAENEGTARHKVDPLGLGGNKRKKSKSRRPAVVNYYYPAPQPQPQYQVPQYQVPQYQVPQYQAPSYGTSYGGGGYGSNAYGSGGYAANSYQRAAVGNEEVDDMLRRHQTLARTIAQPAASQEEKQQEQKTTTTSTTTTSTTTTTEAPPALEEQPLSEQRIHKRLAAFHRVKGSNATPKGCGCGRLDCLCGRSCQCGASAPTVSAAACQCRAGRRRSRRSAEYGTLETIDEGSLNELRREYKMGLKEITLSPDEDPAEALMRYNAASIREALERASQVPLEIGGDEYADGMTHEQQSEVAGEPIQEEEPQYQSQYNHQDFVRLTTAAPETTTEAPATTTEATEAPPAESTTSAPQSPHQLTKDEEIHNLHTVVHHLKQEFIRLSARCQLQSNLAVDDKEKKATKALEEEKVKEEVAEKDGKREEDSKNEVTQPEPETEQDPEPDSEPEEQEESTKAEQETQSPSPKSSQQANAIAKVDGQKATAEAVASASSSSASAVSPNQGETYNEENSWQRILANRGYDTEYLTKDLEVAKGPTYEEYTDMQADGATDPTDATDDDPSKAKRNASLDGKQQAQLLNAALNSQTGDSSAEPSTTPTPYAMRGKFVRRRSTRRSHQVQPSDEGWTRSTRQARQPPRVYPKKVVAPKKKVSTKVTTRASVSTTKLDRLVDVLNDLLRLQLQRERKSLGASPVQSNSLSRVAKSPSKVIKRKRLRRRQQSVPSTARVITRSPPAQNPKA